MRWATGGGCNPWPLGDLWAGAQPRVLYPNRIFQAQRAPGGICRGTRSRRCHEGGGGGGLRSPPRAGKGSGTEPRWLPAPFPGPDTPHHHSPLSPQPRGRRALAPVGGARKRRGRPGAEPGRAGPCRAVPGLGAVPRRGRGGLGARPPRRESRPRRHSASRSSRGGRPCPRLRTMDRQSGKGPRVPPAPRRERGAWGRCGRDREMSTPPCPVCVPARPRGVLGLGSWPPPRGWRG